MIAAIPATMLAFSTFRLDYMPWWVALLIFVVLGAFVLSLGMRSLNSLGPARKWVAISIRLLVVLTFVLLIGGLRIQRKHKALEVWVLRDVSGSTELVGKEDLPTGKNIRQAIDDYLKAAARDGGKKPEDRIGVISFQDQAIVEAMPSTDLKLDAASIPELRNGTDISSAVQLALASMSPDTMHRIVLLSDGNNNAGDLDAAVAAAKSQGIPIDVMPLHYDVQNAVMIDRFVSPTWKRENEAFTITVNIRFTGDKPITGKLVVQHITGGEPSVIATRKVTLDPTLNPQHLQAEHIKVPALHSSGVHRFIAKFTPDALSLTAAGGSITADIEKINQPAESFVFVKGEQQILFVDNYLNDSLQRGPGHFLEDALKDQKIQLKTESIDDFSKNLIDLQNFDAVILGNVPHGAEGISNEQDDMLAQYVHDLGGGLIMLGGDKSFGAGGWQGSKVADILPVAMDVPAQRQVGKGALVLVMHSCEMPEGNYWGVQCALQAIKALSDRDEIGIISYNWGGMGGGGNGGANWDFVLAEKGNGNSVTDAAKRMQLGDMPSFDDALNTALNGVKGENCLAKSNARHKHVIIISDGDPAKPQPGLMKQYRDAKVSISTVTVYPHAGMSSTTMKEIPEEAWKGEDGKGGKAYGPINAKPNQLPQIFIKEATVVRRSLLQEDETNGLAVNLTDASDPIVQGMDPKTIPTVFGMVLTSKKDDPKINMPLASGKLNDPILAHWQSGLGKSLVFTSDPINRWGKNWIQWEGQPGYKEFWRRAVTTVVRPPESGDFEVVTTVNGTKGKIVVTGIGKGQKFLDFLNVKGVVMGPNGKNTHVDLVQTGAGTYEADFNATDAGSYVVGLNYNGKGGDGKQTSGILRGGLAVNSQPEYRDLQSNETALSIIADKTGGRMLPAWDGQNAGFFSRDNVGVTASPLPVFDWLLPILVGLILLDVAMRRIAWDWASIRRMGVTAVNRVRSYTVVRKVKSRDTLDAFTRVRKDVAENTFRPAEGAGAQALSKPPPVPLKSAPDPKAKFEAPAGVEGDISQVVGGASNKPIPSAPKKVEPKGQGKEAGGYTGSLLEAKRRAQEQMKKEQDGK